MEALKTYFTITIADAAETPEDMAELLRKIADMLDDGYTSGFYPTWELEGDE